MKSTESKAKRRLLFVAAILMVVAIGVAYVLIDSAGWNSLSKYAILNGGTSIAACVVTAVLFWSSILEKHREDFREGGLFRILLLAQFVLLYLDFVECLFEASSADLLLLAINTGSFLSYFIIFRTYSHYLMEFGRSEQGQFELLLKFVDFMFLASCVLLVVNLFTDCCFTIVNGTEVKGPFFLALYLFPVCAIALNSVAAIAGQGMRTSERISFLGYSIITAAALGIQNYKINVSVIDMASFISVLIIYINVDGRRGRIIAEQKAQLANAKTGIMLSQVQPYFLRNGLSTIAQLVYEDPAKAANMAEMFAGYVQKNLEDLQVSDLSDFITELRHVKTYVEIQKLHLGDRLNIVYDIEETCFKLPTLTLQPLIENVVEHGLNGTEGNVLITILTRKEENDFLVVIKDNGAGFEVIEDDDGIIEEDPTHIGVQNVRYRVEALCNGSLKLEGCPDVGTVVEIRIPSKTR